MLRVTKTAFLLVILSGFIFAFNLHPVGFGEEDDGLVSLQVKLTKGTHYNCILSEFSYGVDDYYNKDGDRKSRRIRIADRDMIIATHIIEDIKEKSGKASAKYIKDQTYFQYFLVSIFHRRILLVLEAQSWPRL